MAQVIVHNESDRMIRDLGSFLGHLKDSLPQLGLSALPALRNDSRLGGNMRYLRDWFSGLKREESIESGKIVFAIIGVGSTLANIGTMHLWLMFPAVALVFITWAAIYRQML